MRLAAVDVALTEAAIGSGVTGAVLIAAAARLRPTEARSAAERPGAALRIIAAVLSRTCRGGACDAGSVACRAGAQPRRRRRRHTLPALAIGNPVTAVLLAYRAIDTLLEKVVLLLALLGVWSLAPDRFWGGVPGQRHGAHPDGALTCWRGCCRRSGSWWASTCSGSARSHPGGAFQGGAILAAMWILVMIAGLRDAPAIGRRRVRLLLVVGPAVFLAVGLAGFVIGGRFPGLPGGLCEAADHRHRSGADAVHRRDARPAGGRPAHTASAAR